MLSFSSKWTVNIVQTLSKCADLNNMPSPQVCGHTALNARHNYYFKGLASSPFHRLTSWNILGMAAWQKIRCKNGISIFKIRDSNPRFNLETLPVWLGRMQQGTNTHNTCCIVTLQYPYTPDNNCKLHVTATQTSTTGSNGLILICSVNSVYWLAQGLHLCKNWMF